MLHARRVSTRFYPLPLFFLFTLQFHRVIAPTPGSASRVLIWESLFHFHFISFLIALSFICDPSVSLISKSLY